ncbi:MAG: cytochrome P450 [Deltaproteobacteria bacterium]|nr:cytochrome P450 [Deltaproteobacteria bacterium]
MSEQQTDTTVGRNGVAITRRKPGAQVFRTYEIHQRRRVGESTAKLRPGALISPDFLVDPYTPFTTLRENYPCYRDWVGNAYWITRYDDATSIFVDDANYETRPKRWFYGLDQVGRDLRGELAWLQHEARVLDEETPRIVRELVSAFAARGSADLARELAARLPLELLVRAWGIHEADRGAFVERSVRMQRGVHASAVSDLAGKQAFAELTAYFAPLLAKRRSNPGDDFISVAAQLELAEGPATAEDLTATLLECDHETLHGTLANLWFLLLTHPEQLARVEGNRRPEARLLKLAVLEAMRHSAPVLSAKRFAKHEVERFGQVFPEGALIVCVAAAGNRDPRVFSDPDSFVVGRKDLTQREPRGMYRADGLASGIAFALGPPSKHPALPEDRPRSRYALTRDAAVTASNVLLDALRELRLAPGAAPRLQSLGLGEMHTCWHLPVTFRA